VHLPDEDVIATFTCPRCGSTSAHPDDLANGYCGACHAFTGEAGTE
jgi:ribosomal protein S27AE